MNRAEKRRQKKLAKKAASNAKLGKATIPSPGQQSPTIQQSLELAVRHHNAGDLAKAEGIYQQVLQADPNQPIALHLLGVIAHQVGKNDVAVDLIGKALAIKPDYAEAHSNLGVALQKLGKLDEAVASYHKALIIKPDFAEAHNNLGTTFQMLERIEDALASYDLAQLPEARARILECLFALGRYEDFYRELERLIKTESTNLRAAAISAFASQQLGHDDPYPFCKDPLDFVRVGRVCDSAEDTADLMDELVEDLRPRNAVWEPPGNTTKFGFQTRDNLFADPKGSLAKLDRIIKSEIESYYSEFKFANCLFMASWPSQIRLNGWFVRLLGHGHQDDHIHPGGWLSGVIYLKVPKTSNRDEGAIEFGLHGFKYPILNEEYPRTLHRPEKGQIVLFPSSLFHRTVPISADDERLSIAFDLIPA